jgi:hypothetical protein
MRHVFASCITGFLGAALFTTNALAQPVSVGLTNGVHVRAPFVSVDVFPHGRVSVRAPYAAVDVGGRPQYVARPISPLATPTPQSLAAMDEDSLWRLLQAASADLNQQLNRFDTGQAWQQYLRLPSNFGASDPSVGSSDRHAAIVKLLQRFNDVAANPQYSKLSNLTAFTTMRAALSELASRQGNAAPELSAPEELPPPK